MQAINTNAAGMCVDYASARACADLAQAKVPGSVWHVVLRVRHGDYTILPSDARLPKSYRLVQS